MKNSKFIHLVDTTLRDGSHAVSHQFTAEQVAAIAAGLDAAGVEYIEVSHGDGLAGSSFNYGWSAVSEEELLKAASGAIKKGKLTVLLLPGIGTVEDLKMAADCGAKVVRVATHVTEADIGEQHISIAKKMGMMAVGFLMMAHMVPPEKVVEQAKLFESYGADYINIADSAGAMLPEDVKARVGAVVEAVKVPVGFHAHNNLTLATANALAAVEAGATFLDGTCRGLGAGAGNAQTEALVGVLDKAGYQTGIDFYKIMDVAEDIVEPIMHRPQVVRNAPLMLGYAGVYSSFLLHTYRAAEKFNLDPRDILVELGRRRMVGGQEDMIVDVAYQLAQKRGGA
ncbi:MAG: 4-hydroxy-2-oxovalerate/4-hydroxy-2-oxohexanoate aldolase [Moorella sp. (in: firmicutes)]|jgi:4-hydroxy 2-oxovalerate aldolase|uniref:4-hydroxy-2-oxovalerate aldolase n=1 Tax=Moorella sp. E308F TaxID=2572682 RepID=UPI0010FFB253|nr:4-hydroxy-2-oxovalerate aldolase [Moorella sp. E308F]MDK2817611.1 4-hydroxy-2-oxovalerate/4-hydroxy-2-oxohexanoate aldolase [Moorella sp. (in: firmicutes)]GEA16203.1 4-hydroxy-2-oxovalerate aldolase [Moorella sp. E308F]